MSDEKLCRCNQPGAYCHCGGKPPVDGYDEPQNLARNWFWLPLFIAFVLFVLIVGRVLIEVVS